MKQSDQHHPRIVIIDSNRLFRQKISYLLQNETRAAINKIDIFDSFDQFKASSGGDDELDLLIIDERAFNGISKNGQYKLTSFNNPQFHMIIMSMDILHSTNKETIFDTNKVTQLSKSIDPLVFLELVENRLGINKNEQRTHCSISLTPREAEILEELVNGLSNKEIARKLAISDSTVKVHVQNILKKINVSSRVEAAVYAVRHQLIA